jgi:hypothetical protein
MAQLMLVNPRRRRKSTAKKRRTTTRRRTAAPRRSRRRNPIAASAAPRRRRRRAMARVRRRNPIRARRSGMIESTLKPALMAGMGALGVNVVSGFLPIPANFLSGPVSFITRGALALGFGYVVGMMTDKKTAEQMTLGALTVVAYDALKEVASTAMPTLNLSGLNYYSPTYPAGPAAQGQMGYMVPSAGGSYFPQGVNAAPMPTPATPGLGMYSGYDSSSL